jgi:hypothetical protein
MLTPTYESERFSQIPKKNIIRYVRTNKAGFWYWAECDVRDMSKAVRQGTCLEEDVPFAVAEEAKSLVGAWPCEVVWKDEKNI